MSYNVVEYLLLPEFKMIGVFGQNERVKYSLDLEQ